jgi:chromosome segregation ATPase
MADSMDALGEALNDLNDALPKLPERVREVLDAAHEVENEAEQLEAEVRDTDRRAKERFAAVEQDLGSLATEADAHQQALEEDLVEVEAQVQSLSDLDQAHANVEQMVAAVGAAMSGLQARLTEATSTLNQAHDQFEAGLKALEDKVRAGKEALGAAAERVAAEGQALGARLQQEQGEVAQHVSQVEGAAQAAVQQVDAALQGALGELPGLQARLQDALDGFRGDLRTGAQGLAEIWKERLESEVRAQVATAVEVVTGALGLLGEAATSAATEWTQAASPLENDFPAVDEDVRPLQGGVEQVKIAAETVGLNWSTA